MQMKPLNLLRPSRLARLDLELLYPGRRQQLRGGLLLLVGLLAAGVVGYQTWQADHQLSRVQAASRPAVAIAPKPLSADEKAEDHAIEEARLQLALPWGTLFQALEDSASDHIHLINVTPDAASGTLQLVAEAPDVFEMLEYVSDLAKQPFTQVTLSSYDLGKAADQPVRFTLTAAWRRAG